MGNTAALYFIAAINYMSGLVTAVEISTSINPPTLEVGRSVTMTWKVTYREDEKLQFTALSVKKKNGEKFVEIGNNLKGITADREQLLELKATVTISPSAIEVKISNLEHSDEFLLKGTASGATFSEMPMTVSEILSVNDVRGGPTICGNSIMKDQFFIPAGDSSFAVTLCGNPRPKLSYAFDGKTFEVLGIEVDKARRMYRYRIEMKNIDSNHCGQTIRFQISGFENMVKESTVIVKYNPPMIKKFEYTKKIGHNCTTFKITDEHNPKCPLKYKIEIYDKNKISAIIKHNPFIIDSLFSKICRQDLFDMGEFAKVTAIWKHDSFNQSIFGTPSDFVKAQSTITNDDPEDEEKKKSKSLTFVIPLVLGIIIIIMIIVIVLIYKYKQKDKRSSATKPVSEEKGLVIRGKEGKNKGVQSSATNPEQYPLYEPRHPEYYVLEESKPVPPPLYSELGEGGGRTGPKLVLKPESNYADAKDVDYPDNKHSLYPNKYQRQKDVFDPVDSSDSDDDNCNQGVSPGKVFKPLFGDESGNVSRQKCASTNQDQEISASCIYPKGYNINKGLPVYLDSNASITNNPPKVAFYERKTAPGMPKLPPVAYPKFDRSDNV